MTEAERYPTQVFWSDEDEGFIALAPDLPGCSAWGATQADSIAELQQAICVWIDGAREIGKQVPAPSSHQPDQDYSGKLLLRLPRSLHGDLARCAEAEGISLNQYIIYRLSVPSISSGPWLTVVKAPDHRAGGSGVGKRPEKRRLVDAPR